MSSKSEMQFVLDVSRVRETEDKLRTQYPKAKFKLSRMDPSTLAGAHNDFDAKKASSIFMNMRRGTPMPPPAVVRNADGVLTVVDGHHRWYAARVGFVREIPVLLVLNVVDRDPHATHDEMNGIERLSASSILSQQSRVSALKRELAAIKRKKPPAVETKMEQGADRSLDLSRVHQDAVARKSKELADAQDQLKTMLKQESEEQRVQRLETRRARLRQWIFESDHGRAASKAKIASWKRELASLEEDLEKATRLRGFAQGPSLRNLNGVQWRVADEDEAKLQESVNAIEREGDEDPDVSSAVDDYWSTAKLEPGAVLRHDNGSAFKQIPGQRIAAPRIPQSVPGQISVPQTVDDDPRAQEHRQKHRLLIEKLQQAAKIVRSQNHK